MLWLRDNCWRGNREWGQSELSLLYLFLNLLLLLKCLHERLLEPVGVLGFQGFLLVVLHTLLTHQLQVF